MFCLPRQYANGHEQASWERQRHA